MLTKAELLAPPALSTLGLRGSNQPNGTTRLRAPRGEVSVVVMDANTRYIYINLPECVDIICCGWRSAVI